MPDLHELMPITLGEYIGTVTAAVLIAASVTALACLWLGDRRGARRAWNEAQDALSASEDQRGQLVEKVARLETRIGQRDCDAHRRVARIQRIRALTLNDHGDPLPHGTPLTVGQVCDALDRTPFIEEANTISGTP